MRLQDYHTLCRQIHPEADLKFVADGGVYLGARRFDDCQQLEDWLWDHRAEVLLPVRLSLDEILAIAESVGLATQLSARLAQVCRQLAEPWQRFISLRTEKPVEKRTEEATAISPFTTILPNDLCYVDEHEVTALPPTRKFVLGAGLMTNLDQLAKNKAAVRFIALVEGGWAYCVWPQDCKSFTSGSSEGNIPANLLKRLRDS